MDVRTRGLAAPPRSSLARALYRLGVGLVGGLTVAVGLVLVPLPGPGWAIVLVGTTLLGTQFAWAARVSAWARRRVGRAARWTGRRSWPVRGAVVVGLALSAVGPVVVLAL